MPVFESTDHITPRSALRYRPIEDEAARSGRRPSATTGIRPVAQRASRLRPRPADTLDGDSRAASTARRSKAPKSANPAQARTKWGFNGRVSPLLYLGLGMLAMLALWTLLSLAVSWWNTTMDDLHYGHPRTFQTDAYVGHNEVAAPSHFIALNYRGRIEVIEFPGGDASHARIYLGPQLYGAGSDLVPVTLSFVDVSGQHRPDMLVHFQSSRLIFINASGGFRPPTAQEQQAVERYLAAHGQ